MRITARRESVALSAGGAALALLLGGCGMFGGGPEKSDAKGVLSAPRASAASAAASPAPSGSGAAGTAGAAAVAAPIPSLRPKPNAAGLQCNPQALDVHLSQASGAVHTYLARPVASGTKVLALRNARSTATASKAASYAARQLTTGLSASSGCATTGALTSVAKRTSGYLATLSHRLERGSATKAQVSAAEALIADVNSQAGRLGFTVRDRVPDVTLLGR